MTVVYIDSVFVLNALMDYFLLLATAHLAGGPVRRGRYVLAAALGGAYAVAVFLPGCGALAGLPAKLGAGAVMAAVAFGRRGLLRRSLLLGLVSCGFAGCVLGLGLAAGGVPMAGGVFYTDVDAGVLLTGAGAAYVVASVVFRAAARHGLRGAIVPVALRWDGRSVRCRALWDTGNELRDPASGRPVLVAWGAAMADLWPPELRAALSDRALAAPAETLSRLPGLWRTRFSLTPYRAVGLPGGLLLTARVEEAEIAERRYERLPVALSPTPVGEGFAALWGGEVERSGKYESFTDAAAPSGVAEAKERRPLHWRQRHAACAPGPGAGSGAAGPHRGGGRPADPDRT